jgi:DNA-binding transcriptional LysR family regulator
MLPHRPGMTKRRHCRRLPLAPRLLEEWTPAFPGFFLYDPSRRQAPPALSAFVNALRRHWSARTAGRA